VVRVRGVLDDRQELDGRTCACETGGDHGPVRLVDLARLELGARRAKLGARSQDGDPRAHRAQELAHARGCQSSDVLGGESRAHIDDDVAGAHVAASRSHMLTGCNPGCDGDALLAVLDELYRDDCVRSVRNRAARRDTCRGTRRQRARRRPPRSDAKGDRKLSRCIDCPDREPVHRRAGEGREIDPRACRLPEHSSVRLFERHRLGGERRRVGEDLLERLLDGQQLRLHRLLGARSVGGGEAVVSSVDVVVVVLE
jgi:hypothetical protein